MADIVVATDSQSTGNETSGDGRRLVFTTEDIGYMFYVEGGSDNLQYKKTSDGGATWGSSVDVETGQVELFTIWYDRWTPGDTGTIIHTFFCVGPSGEVKYRSLDTNGDSLGTAVVIEDNAATAITEATSYMSATKARGGNLYIAYYWDTTVDFTNFERSTDAGANWTARTNVFEGVTEQIQLYPGGAADNQDIIAIFWDFSADELSRKLYDDSGDSWGETSISTSMVEAIKTTVSPQFAGSVRHSDNVVVIAAWTAPDNADAELRCWFISESAITEKTNIVDNAVVATTDDMMGAAVCINKNNEDIYVFQLGAEGGGETIGSLLNVYYYVSTDDGATWSSQTAYSEDTADDHRTLACDLGGTNSRVAAIWFNDDLNDFYYNLANSIEILPATAAVTGTATASITEADIVTGGKTIIITLTGGEWIAAGSAFDAQRDEIIAGLDSAQSELLGWDNVVKTLQGVAGVVRTSATVVTITLDAQATYNITATETITVTVPGTAVLGGTNITASPTFTVTATGGTAVKDVIQSGIIAFAR